jgi:hypothetical protein
LKKFALPTHDCERDSRLGEVPLDIWIPEYQHSKVKRTRKGHVETGIVNRTFNIGQNGNLREKESFHRKRAAEPLPDYANLRIEIMVVHDAQHMSPPQWLLGSSHAMSNPLTRRKQSFFNKLRKRTTNNDHAHTKPFGKGSDGWKHVPRTVEANPDRLPETFGQLTHKALPRRTVQDKRRELPRLVTLRQRPINLKQLLHFT